MLRPWYVGMALMGWLASGTALAQANVPEPALPAHVVLPEDIIVDDTQTERAADAVQPMFIALFGDSVSMATMADAKMGNPGPRFFADFLSSIATAKLYEATLGRFKPTPDEVERHEQLTKFFGNMARIPLSPYLGNQDYSLPVLIKEVTGLEPKVYNGAQMAGSYHFGDVYLDKFEKFFQRNPFHKKPELIVVNFNGMDFMDNRKPEEYAASLRDFYTRLTKLSPFSTLVVTGIGDPIPLLTYPDRVSVPHSPFGPITCSKLYETVRFGNSTGVYPGAPDSAIAAARERLYALRQVLVDEIERVNNDQEVYPHFKGEAVLVPAAEDDGTMAEHIAADCIHPDTVLVEATGWRMWDVIKPLL